MVRTAAVTALGEQVRGTDVPALLDAFAASISDPVADARAAILRALGRLAERDATIAPAFLRRFPRSPGYLARVVARENFAAVEPAWGAPFPTETGLQPGDYAEIARRLVWPAEHEGRLPGLTIETDRGPISLTLFAADAPVTVHAILRLADRRFFDGGTWHRIVPGFVAQAGDPRGDGAGGPGFALRDEPNPYSYVTGTVGMALDGADSGGSQFFITLAPQPHLDTTYTVIGRVDSGMDVLRQMVQGDRVRSIRTR
jgi:cyclophilin family peptidyl-prolyl cis-trans isomerase